MHILHKKSEIILLCDPASLVFVEHRPVLRPHVFHEVNECGQVEPCQLIVILGGLCGTVEISDDRVENGETP